MQHEISVVVSLSEDSASAVLQYSLRRNSTHMIGNVAESFQKALFALAASPLTVLGKISLLSAADTTHLQTWNQNLPPLMMECVHEKVRAQALLKPDFEALCSFDQGFSYSELEQAAERLAARLTNAGVKPGSYVPLCFDKSSWAIVSMYAVLKAGKSPCKPKCPSETDLN